MKPDLVGNYVIDHELGRGGMGVVYAATHRVLGRRAAIKLLLPELSQRDGQVQRFFNEARAAMAIAHPGIVEIYDVGVAADGRAYIAMELLHGESLAQRLRRGALPVRTAIELVRQIAGALVAAHAARVIHRDLKPDNVFLGADERVTLLDFGIAKLTDDHVKTATGAVLGTPHYMAPEQCGGPGPIDQRADLYALGCVLFRMLTGSVPFDADELFAVVGMHLTMSPPPLGARCPAASAALAAVVARLLAKAPADRYQTASELLDALADPAVLELSSAAGSAAATAPGPPLAVDPTAPTIGSAPAQVDPMGPTIGSGARTPRAEPAVGDAATVPVPSSPGLAIPRRARMAVAAIAAGAIGTAAIVVATRGGDRPEQTPTDRTPDAGITNDSRVAIAPESPSARDAAKARSRAEVAADFERFKRGLPPVLERNDCGELERYLASVPTAYLYGVGRDPVADELHHCYIRAGRYYRAEDRLDTDIHALVKAGQFEAAMAACLMNRPSSDWVTPCAIAACQTEHVLWARLWTFSWKPRDLSAVGDACKARGFAYDPREPRLDLDGSTLYPPSKPPRLDKALMDQIKTDVMPLIVADDCAGAERYFTRFDVEATSDPTILAYLDLVKGCYQGPRGGKRFITTRELEQADIRLLVATMRYEDAITACFGLRKNTAFPVDCAIAACRAGHLPWARRFANGTSRTLAWPQRQAIASACAERSLELGK